MHEYDHNYYVGFSRSSKKKSYSKFLILIIILIVIIFFLFKLFNFFIRSDKSTENAPKNNSAVIKKVDIKPTKLPSVELKNILDKKLGTLEGQYSVYVKNLESGEEYRYNPDSVYDTASLYKLWVMAETIDQVEQGKFSYETVMSRDVVDLNKAFGIDEENAELTEGTITQNVDYSLNKMITISDNYSALLLSLNVGLQNVRDFLEEYGFNNSKLGTTNSYPQSTVSDIGTFFEDVYNGELVSKSASEKMLELLSGQQLNNGIPRNLPEEIKIAHKTGELGEFKHDAGIVFTDKGNYILVVMSKTNSQEVAQENIADISKTVFDYFSDK